MRDLKSQEDPTDQVETYTIVGKTWEKITQDPSKDVFVFYYAYWCRECMQLAVIWDELADYVKDSDDVMIAKFNTPENEVDGLKIAKFPSMRLYTKENKKGIEFKDEHSMENYKIFLNQHSSNFRAHYDKVSAKVVSEDL